jgi:hypothetical protein
MDKVHRYFLLVLFFLFIFVGYGDSEDLSSTGRTNFYELKELYDKWDLGLYGSRKYFRSKLNSLLTKKIGSYIYSEMDYRISVYDMVEKRYYSSDLYNHKWLHFHGEVDKESLKYLLGKGYNVIEDKKYLFFISGKIKKFRIHESEYGR